VKSLIGRKVAARNRSASAVDFRDPVRRHSRSGGAAAARRKETKMKYIALIYGDHDVWEAMSPDEQKAQYAEYGRFAEEARERGKMLGGDELESATTATTVRVRNGETLTTDGPFTETKEQLGGYFLLECDDLDEAIELAAKIPAARGGAVEVRPVVERQ
jgi:hypothetical protein